MSTNTVKVNVTVKDVINARTASVKLQTAPETFSVRAIAIMNDKDKSTGEERPVGYLFAEDGTVYGTVSATAIDTINAVAESVNAGDLELPLIFKVSLRTSAAGRQFIALSIE